MKSLIEKALRGAYKTVQQFGPEAMEVVEAGEGFGEIKGDIELKADREIGATVQKILRTDKAGQIIEIEGLGRKLTQKKAQLLRTVDPLDGSLNFLRRQDSQGLPYCTAIAEFAEAKPYFKDCRAAGVIDLRNGDLWLVEKERGCALNSKSCHVSSLKKIDKGQGPIIIVDFYYPDNRELLTAAFSDFRGYLRSAGSASYEMALVACGAVDAYISIQQKNDVLGAGYLLVKEAGGTVVDFEGKDIGDRLYEFRGQTPIIIAATKELAEKILERVYKALKK